MGEWLAFTFALSGRRFGFYVTQGVALGLELAGLSAREGRPNIRPPHFASKVSYSASPQESWPSLCEQSELQCFAPPFSPVPAMSLPCRRFAAEGNATRGRE